MPAALAALSAFRKSRHAMITCHLPVSARALAAARPKPEEAPVTMTLPFLSVFFCSEIDLVTTGGATADVCAIIVLFGLPFFLHVKGEKAKSAFLWSETETPKKLESFRDALNFASFEMDRAEGSKDVAWRAIAFEL
uniref:Uncharacterized protein n=1 Tax=Opuntia streptacantha TaxID=393608 RepID=A0A7C8ZVV3_OPUST